MDLITKIKLFMFYSLIGEDEFGNKYFQQSVFTGNKKPKRIVKYKGIVEASKIPSGWHGWIHYNKESKPENDENQIYDWQKKHLPNLTGTIYAQTPYNYIDKYKKHNKTNGDYEPWSPKS